MQGLKLSPQLLVLQFHLLALAALLMELGVKFLQLVFVVALGAPDLLRAMPYPAGGQAFQMRAAIPIRAREVLGQVLKLRHR